MPKCTVTLRIHGPAVEWSRATCQSRVRRAKCEGPRRSSLQVKYKAQGTSEYELWSQPKALHRHGHWFTPPPPSPPPPPHNTRVPHNTRACPLTTHALSSSRGGERLPPLNQSPFHPLHEPENHVQRPEQKSRDGTVHIHIPPMLFSLLSVVLCAAAALNPHTPRADAPTMKAAITSPMNPLLRIMHGVAAMVRLCATAHRAALTSLTHFISRVSLPGPAAW